MRGAPDWLAEVLSPRTASHDQVVKLPVYERAGVKEVWTLQPSDRTLSIYLLAGGGYGRPAILELKGKTAMTAVPDVTIDWDRIIARLV
jgi:Uma2 family endonuclease